MLRTHWMLTADNITELDVIYIQKIKSTVTIVPGEYTTFQFHTGPNQQICTKSPSVNVTTYDEEQELILKLKYGNDLQLLYREEYI